MNQNEIWTLSIAAYAAAVSTFVLGWDAYKWLVSGPTIDLSVSTGMSLLSGGVLDPEAYVTVTAWNVGDRPTTITNLGGMHFDSWWRAHVIRRNAKTAFVVNQPSQAQRIPYRFEVGDQWIGMIDQNDGFAQMISSGYLFIVLYTTGARGHRIRVRVPETR